MVKEDKVTKSKEDKIITFESLEKELSEKTGVAQPKEAMRLVRCLITCNNKNKVNYTGEIFSVRNSVLPEVKKFVQFGSPTHIPLIIYNMLKEKQYQMFVEKRLPNGNIVKESKLIPEYNIQILPPITTEELEAIKKKQLAEGFNGE